MSELTDAAAAHAVETYTAGPRSSRHGMALCLSGGGFRAALFHLGALRRLNEFGILSSLDAITAVSGGSIIAAHLATVVRPWPERGAVIADWESRVAAPFRAFTARNLRTWPILNRLLPWNWFRTSTGVETLAALYERRLTTGALSDLPDRPNFIFCATDMAFGVNWLLEKRQMGDYQAGYASPPPPWLLARAVAASSCFPPVFNPLPLGLSPVELSGGKAPAGSSRDAAIRGLRLTDGGNYDNLGLEPVWKSYRTLLVSDGGETLDPEADKSLIWRLGRYITILSNQSTAIRKRWLIANFVTGELEGAYWGIGSPTSHYKDGSPSGYSEELVSSVVSDVRTDMDAFSVAESDVLENHGYQIADAAIQTHASGLAAAGAVPLSTPHPEWMDENRVRDALRESHQVKLPLGRW